MLNPTNPYVGGQGKTDVVLHSSGTYTLTAADSGKILLGLSNDVVFQLPVMEEGMMFEFMVISSGRYVRINANGTDSIRLGAGTVTAAGGYMRSNARTAWVKLFGPSDGGTQWNQLNYKYGWTIDS
jgi:hypothetical protein